MIYIIDNGQDWSDHAIHFVDMEDLSAESARRVVERLPWSKGPIVLAVARDVEWRAPSAVDKWCEFLDPSDPSLGIAQQRRAWEHRISRERERLGRLMEHHKATSPVLASCQRHINDMELQLDKLSGGGR